MVEVTTIPALGDNFIYLCQYNQTDAFAVDPAESISIMKILTEKKLNLTAVFATHHHFDHTAGIKELKQKTNCQVFSLDKNRIPHTDILLCDSEIVTLDTTRIKVLETPGHTETSACFYIEPQNENQPPALFTGDTLFIAGCGRLLECDAQTMYNSLQKIASLPENTLVYPGHNYTEENYQFALTIESGNKIIQTALEKLYQNQKNAIFTPSTIAFELKTNIFLRTSESSVKTALNLSSATDTQTFAHLRKLKDKF